MYSTELTQTRHTQCAPKSVKIYKKTRPTNIIDAKIEINSNENQSDFLNIRFGETCVNKHTVISISLVPLSIPLQV